MAEGVALLPVQGLQLGSTRGIEGMARMAGLGEGDRSHGHRCRRQGRQDLLIAAAPNAVVSPPQPDNTGWLPCRGHAAGQPGIVLWAHGIGAAPQQSGGGTHPGKQIQHLHRPKAPAPGKAHDAAQGGIVAVGIGVGGIEAEEEQAGAIGLPHPLQPPAVTATGTQGSGSNSRTTRTSHGIHPALAGWVAIDAIWGPKGLPCQERRPCPSPYCCWWTATPWPFAVFMPFPKVAKGA